MTTADALTLSDAHRPPALVAARRLIEAYAASLSFDLTFQGFDAELAGLPGAYAPPDGCLLVAAWDGHPCGCGALRPLADGTCELKRLFVLPAYRGRRIGRRLVQALIDRAAAMGYARIWLDTVPSMQAARSLYAAMGFHPVPPYRPNPVEGTAYLEYNLLRTS